MSVVQRNSTPIDALDAAVAILSQVKAHFPGITQDGARLLLAHIWFETANGKSLQNFNPGNVMAKGFKSDGSGDEYSVWSGDYWRPSWFTDESNKNHAPMLDGLEPSAFRAYPSMSAGLDGYMANVARKPAMVAALKSGSPSAFASAVVSSGYTPFAPRSLGTTLQTRMDAFKTEGYFNSLPKGTRMVGIVGSLAVLGVTGYIFWGTLQAAKKVKR